MKINCAKPSPFGGTDRQTEEWSDALVIEATIRVEGTRWIFVNQGTRRSAPWVNGNGLFYRAEELASIEIVVRGDHVNAAEAAATIQTLRLTERCRTLAAELAAAQVERDNARAELRHDREAFLSLHHRARNANASTPHALRPSDFPQHPKAMQRS